MISRLFQIALVVLSTVTLWMVPSGGTQGQGTLGDRFVHPGSPTDYG